jgi:uncharacterized damage-inducible protein DinB
VKEDSENSAGQKPMKKFLVPFVIFCLGGSAIFAQSSNSFTTVLAKHWQTSKAFTLAVIDKMPDDQFSFKATPAEMSFGEMASHIADANMAYCSMAAGAKPPAKGTDFSKAGVTKHLTESFDFCIAGIQKADDATLLKTLGEGQRQSTALERYWGAFTHTAHHRGQLEVYLRLKNIEPPGYKF